MVVIYCVLLL